MLLPLFSLGCNRQSQWPTYRRTNGRYNRRCTCAVGALVGTLVATAVFVGRGVLVGVPGNVVVVGNGVLVGSAVFVATSVFVATGVDVFVGRGVQFSPSSVVKADCDTLPASCDTCVRPVMQSVSKIGSSELSDVNGLLTSS